MTHPAETGLVNPPERRLEVLIRPRVGRAAHADPDDARGLRVRAASGLQAETMAAAGAKVVSVNADALETALRDGEVDVASASTAAIAHAELVEQFACYTPPGETTPNLVHQPVLIRKATLDALNDEQRAVLARASLEATSLYRRESERQDRRSVDAFRAAGATIREMLPEEFDAWRLLARENADRLIAERDADKALVDLAFSIE